MNVKHRIKEGGSLLKRGLDGLNTWVEVRKRRLADKLNQRCARHSATQTAIGLVVFCLLFGALIVGSIWVSLKPASRIEVPDQIDVPKYIIGKDTQSVKPDRTAAPPYPLQEDSLQPTTSSRRSWSGSGCGGPGCSGSLDKPKRFDQPLK